MLPALQKPVIQMLPIFWLLYIRFDFRKINIIWILYPLLYLASCAVFYSSPYKYLNKYLKKYINISFHFEIFLTYRKVARIIEWTLIHLCGRLYKRAISLHFIEALYNMTLQLLPPPRLGIHPLTLYWPCDWLWLTKCSPIDLPVLFWGLKKPWMLPLFLCLSWNLATAKWISQD